MRTKELFRIQHWLQPRVIVLALKVIDARQRRLAIKTFITYYESLE